MAKKDKDRGKLLTRRAIVIAGGQLGLLARPPAASITSKYVQSDRYRHAVG